MNWLALIGALVKLAASLAAALRDRALVAVGAARGRAASDADHARAAAARAAEMRAIADKPPSRADVQRRLEEGSG